MSLLTRTDVRRLTATVVALGLLGLSGTTAVRASAWKTELSLWTAAVAVTPNKPRPWINLGLAREVSGDLPGAFQAQQTAYALAFQPRLTRYQQAFTQIASLTNLARMLAQHDQEAAAERMLVQVVEAVPLFPHAQYNLAVLYAKTGRCAEGRVFADRARALDKSFLPLVCE